MNEREVLVNSLKFHLKDYPFGAPLLAVPTGAVPNAGSRTPVLKGFFFTSSDPLSDAENLLLRAAVEKGLKRRFSEQMVRKTRADLTDSTEKPAGKNLLHIELHRGLNPELPFAARFSAEKPIDQLGSGTEPKLLTFHPAEVLADGRTKRLFWEDLKLLDEMIEK